MLAEAFKAFEKSVTADQRAAIAQNAVVNAEYFKSMDPTKVDDPALRAAIRIAKVDLRNLADKRTMWSRMGYTFTTPNQTNPLDKYPLFNYSVFNRNPKHVYQYLNDAYAASL